MKVDDDAQHIDTLSFPIPTICREQLPTKSSKMKKNCYIIMISILDIPCLVREVTPLVTTKMVEKRMLIMKNRYEKKKTEGVGCYTQLVDCEKMQQSYIPENISEWVDQHGNGEIMSKAKQPESRCYQLVVFTRSTLTLKRCKSFVE